MTCQEITTIKTNVRQSNFELLRLVSMFFILFYHELLFFIVKMDDTIIYKALEMPLHVGVICFVLISGYFHIRPSIHGAVKLLMPLLLFYLPLTLWEMADGVGPAKSLFIFSKSPYWFIRTYFYLFLISPILNNFLINNKQRFQMLCVLFFIAVYMGTMHEPSLKNGKNLALFMFLYVLGDCLKALKSKYERWRLKWMILAYLTLNIVIVITYIIYHDNILGKLVWLMSFPYCSPILILNATLLFLVFAKISFKSRVINWLSSSVLSIYVLHHQHFILCALIGSGVYTIYRIQTSVYGLLLGLVTFTIVIMSVCIVIDKLFRLTQIDAILTKYIVKANNYIQSKIF